MGKHAEWIDAGVSKGSDPFRNRFRRHHSTWLSFGFLVYHSMDALDGISCRNWSFCNSFREGIINEKIRRDVNKCWMGMKWEENSPRIGGRERNYLKAEGGMREDKIPVLIWWWTRDDGWGSGFQSHVCFFHRCGETRNCLWFVYSYPMQPLLQSLVVVPLTPQDQMIILKSLKRIMAGGKTTNGRRASLKSTVTVLCLSWSVVNRFFCVCHLVFSISFLYLRL